MKILIIRFSSFGDVLQTLSVASRLTDAFPQAEIHWVTRAEFVPLIETHPAVRRVWSLNKGARLPDVTALGRALKAESFTHVYDAHNNLRSRILSTMLNGVFGWRRLFGGPKFLRRSIYRGRRFMLFKFRINLFPKPFTGQFALLEPLAKWGVPPTLPATPQLHLSGEELERVGARVPTGFGSFVALAPSAAFPLKRWPLEHWKELIRLLPDLNFVALGGPADEFIDELVAIDPRRVVSWAGRLSLTESADAIALARALVANDTGLMHVAEQIGKPCVALMGPAPFGYPARPATRVLERDLPCRPCSKHGQGPCVNPNFHACLRTITPAEVAAELRTIVNA